MKKIIYTLAFVFCLGLVGNAIAQGSSNMMNGEQMMQENKGKMKKEHKKMHKGNCKDKNSADCKCEGCKDKEKK